jgi:methanogenic corrinoid protein MtbC1
VKDEAVILIGALLEDDSATALACIERCRADGLDRAAVLERVLVPALSTLGQEWAHRRVSDDAFAAAGVTADQVIAFSAPAEVAPDTGLPVVVGCPVGDGHPALAVVTASILAVEGHRVTDLGAEASASAFLESARSSNAALVVVCGSTTAALPRAAEVTELLGSEMSPAPVVVAVGAPFASASGTEPRPYQAFRDPLELAAATRRLVADKTAAGPGEDS